MEKKLDKFYRSEIKKVLGESTINLSEILKQSRVLYGTFGYHDSEPPHSVIMRKTNEIRFNNIGFWGTGVNKKNIGKIRAFCEKSNEPVYLLLKYTSSKLQSKKNELKKAILDVSQIKEDGGYYEAYIDENGIKKNVQAESSQICIKGNKNQNTAFVVEKYYLLKDTFRRKALLERYEGVTDSSDKRMSGDCLLNQAPCYLLDNMSADDTEQEDGDAWGIVLKLKYPYIVSCDDYIV